MVESFFYIVLAILGLGVLVFIHELGHYIVARRKKMKVEVFSIGFGKPIYSWNWGGVKWMIGMLPFGGYVKIAGMHKEGSKEPYEIDGGFYSKTPWQRIQVALAGPAVNIVFALLVFTFLWAIGGRNKPFSEFTHHVGWVDPKSELYVKGVRPGDVFEQYDGKSFQNFRDLLIASLMDEGIQELQGYKIDYLTQEKIPFHYTFSSSEENPFRSGSFAPASYLIFDGSPISKRSPLYESGLHKRDRVIWADGEVIFSPMQLTSLTNESSAFLTVKRGSRVFQTKVARIPLEELALTGYEKAEIGDWQHEKRLKGALNALRFIPYALSPNCIVERSLSLIDELERDVLLRPCERCSYYTPLQEGDQIVAIDGHQVENGYDLLERLQTRRVLLMVDRNPQEMKRALWTQADAQFDHFSSNDLDQIVASIGTDSKLASQGTLHLLEPIVPKPREEVSLSFFSKTKLEKEIQLVRKQIEQIADPERKKEALEQLEASQKQLVLGLSLEDRKVVYNPNPFQQFREVLYDTWRALFGLFSGSLNIKYMSGPVGIIHVVQQSWMIGAKEALFWMAMISLNLGVMNLLPIPILDGGHIVFSLVETVTRRPLKAKTMERLIIPFVFLLIAFFLYITYHDLARIFTRFF